jgi:putative phosphonate metabolism protein
MGDWRRHAIYFAPPAGSPLAEFGADWLGWDPATGRGRDGFDLPGLPLRRAELVATPARYGFHATLKAPFRLGPGRDVAALDAAVAAVAAGFAGFEVGLRLAALGRFVALVPSVPVPRLAELESACVTRLDGFRAPSAPEEIARRRAAGLDAVEEENLLRWGYPWVLARFRFHLTLTGPLDPAEIAPTRAALAPALAPLLAAPVRVGAICRFAEDADGRFRIVSRHALAG